MVKLCYTVYGNGNDNGNGNTVDWSFILLGKTKTLFREEIRSSSARRVSRRGLASWCQHTRSSLIEARVDFCTVREKLGPPRSAIAIVVKCQMAYRL